ncbi:DNA-3-methyladenine glycosylase I [Maribacter antarcticus]|uniref:DNA-3-methyladenine glycosylase I n=1 Tax=Maribacter antarcticus TaxID=505250 RepID=UPI00047A2EB8|nr:DNA-3-methyladenine glycosylase I [Maribacter antarcticus]
MLKNKCEWCKGNALYEKYHDEEWGVPVRNDDTLFEFLMLETFQSGLSWITVLKKRENFRAAFDNFDCKMIALYKQSEIDSLLQNPGIIRNRLKITATISNAKAFIEIQKEHGSFSNYIWAFVNHKPIKNGVKNYKDGPANNLLSETLSNDLKKKGVKFVGSTVIYAYMQATGMVNDHEISCFRYNQV